MSLSMAMSQRGDNLPVKFIAILHDIDEGHDFKFKSCMSQRINFTEGGGGVVMTRSSSAMLGVRSMNGTRQTL